MSRVLVVGLDALDPRLVARWRDRLPHIDGLMRRGIHGPLRSIVQPITPVAWPALLSGRDAGHLGFTDFRYRVDRRSYTSYRLVHSGLVGVPTLATLASAAGLGVNLVGVPVTYPPIAIEGGVCVSCFMAPSTERVIVAPASRQAELLGQTTSPYVLDAVAPERAASVDRSLLLRRIREMDRQRFDIARYLMRTSDWSLTFVVAMGTDRIGHYFMRYLDPEHGRYDPDARFRDAIADHYRYCDERLGDLMDCAGPDAVVVVVSDHGIQRLDGRVNLNDWLAANGYLHLEGALDWPVPLAEAPIDWARTLAWAQGYGGQISVNLRGREPLGAVAPGDRDALLDRLEADLRGLSDAAGRPLGAVFHRRDAVCTGPLADRCPDLFVQFDELRHLTSDLIGHAQHVSPVTRLGIDDASHANSGFLAMAGPGIPDAGEFSALHLLDLAPTVLDLLGVAGPDDLEGRPIRAADEVYSDADERALTNRLRSLYVQ